MCSLLWKRQSCEEQISYAVLGSSSLFNRQSHALRKWIASFLRCGDLLMEIILLVGWYGEAPLLQTLPLPQRGQQTHEQCGGIDLGTDSVKIYNRPREIKSHLQGVFTMSNWFFFTISRKLFSFIDVIFSFLTASHNTSLPHYSSCPLLLLPPLGNSPEWSCCRQTNGPTQEV